MRYRDAEKYETAQEKDAVDISRSLFFSQSENDSTGTRRRTVSGTPLR
jgi:hypothetical protein